MISQDENIQRLMANIKTPLSPELLSGRLCGLICEVCPLRPWKSAGITAISCQQLLTVTSPLPRKNNWFARLKAMFNMQAPSSLTEIQRH